MRSWVAEFQDSGFEEWFGLQCKAFAVNSLGFVRPFWILARGAAGSPPHAAGTRSAGSGCRFILGVPYPRVAVGFRSSSLVLNKMQATETCRLGSGYTAA